MNKQLQQGGDFSARLAAGIKSIQWPLIALGMILLFNLIFTEGFFEISIQNGRLVGSLMDLLKRAAPRLIVALGMTLVIATGGIDISVGSIAAIAGALAVLVIRGGDITYLATQDTSTVSILLVIIVALAAASVCGLFNGLLVSVVKIMVRLPGIRPSKPWLTQKKFIHLSAVLI